MKKSSVRIHTRVEDPAVQSTDNESTMAVPASLDHPVLKTQMHEHRVHFYDESSYPTEELSYSLSTQLKSGSSAMIVVTEPHRMALYQALLPLGVDVDEMTRAGRLLALDAGETLAKFTVRGALNQPRFREVVGGEIERVGKAKGNRDGRVVILGEMVALLLLEGKSEEAIELEGFWNELGQTLCFTLHCAYPIDAFCEEEHESAFLRICSEHSHIAPVGNYAAGTIGREQLMEIGRLQQREQAHHALLKTKGELSLQIAERIEVERKLIDSQRVLRQLSVRLLRTQDEERQRLGRELHDSVGQYLVAVKMALDMMNGRLDARHGMRPQIADCTALVERALSDVRTMSYLLYPPLLEESGLESAVAYYLDGFMKRSGIAVTVEIPERLERLPREVELSVFRLLQESLTNVHRHSGSRTARLSLKVRDGSVTIAVEDRGKGIDAKVLEMMRNSGAAFGVGMRGMKERIRQLGGEMEVRSTSAGTVVSARVPCVYAHEN